MTLHRAGRIVRPHGLDGALQCVPEHVDHSTLAQRDRWYVGMDASSVMLRTVDSVRRHQTARGEALIVRFAGVDSREDAKRLAGALVFVPEDLPEGGRADDHMSLEDFGVVDQEGKSLGTVSEIRPMPAQDVMVVLRHDGSEILIPAITPFVVRVDTGARHVVVDLPDGFLDI